MKFFPQFIFRSPLNSISSQAKYNNSALFFEALYLSTPVMHEEYQKHLKYPITNYKELKKLNISLYKYQTRANTRCTPFGLFAGLGIGKWSNKNTILIDANIQRALNRKTRLDMNILCSIAQELAKKDYIKNQLKFFPNTSIYFIGNSYRYVEYYYVNAQRFHKINKVDFSDYLEYILIEAEKGLTKFQLATLLVNEDINLKEATGFVEELISLQLLTNQLEPTLTGDDYFAVLLKNLEEINSLNYSREIEMIIELLKKIDTKIKINDTTILNSINTYKEIYTDLKIILPELKETNLFQTDLYKKTLSATLDENVKKDIEDSIKFLNKITPPAINTNLENFKKRFYERYEDNEVSLLVALDTETGLGYPAINTNGINELIEDINIYNKNNSTDLKWDTLQATLLKLIIKNNKTDKQVITISEDDFNEIDYSSENLPSTFAAMFKLIDPVKNKIQLKNIGGSSAINLLGRFANGNEELEAIVQKLAQFEQLQMPGKILAEIIHLPESRTGNILARPRYRPYEIPYLAKSSVEQSFQIKAKNLTLKISNDKIILFDKINQKEIIPCLGNAHNFSNNSLPVYHFLCDLQTQFFSKPYLGFDWGVLSEHFNFLPRVEYRNCILSSARWQLQTTDLLPLQDLKKTDQEKRSLFAELKEKLKLPEKFLIIDGDNELLIDNEIPIAVDTFIDMVKNRKKVLIEEYLFTADNNLINDTAGNPYTNECVAIVLNEAKQRNETAFQTSKPFVSKQLFSIGSEWVYYKIYCGVKAADFILTEKIKYITEQLTEKNIIDKWFFIRYADPNTHLRLRFHISNFEKYYNLLRLLNEELEPLLRENIISLIQTDTYKRELGRYGDNSIELAESLFHYDSIFVTNMLNLLDPDSGETIRWQIAIRSVDEFLNDFKLDSQEKYNIISALAAAFLKEHGGEKELKILLDNKFRVLRSQIEEVLNTYNDREKDYYPIIELLVNRSESNNKTIERILELKHTNKLQVNFEEVLASLLHMNLDRLFIARNRTNEFVVYELLARYYKSKLARVISKQASENTFQNASIINVKIS